MSCQVLRRWQFGATGRYDVKSPNCAIYQALYPEVIGLEGLLLMAQAQLVRVSSA